MSDNDMFAGIPAAGAATPKTAGAQQQDMFAGIPAAGGATKTSKPASPAPQSPSTNMLEDDDEININPYYDAQSQDIVKNLGLEPAGTVQNKQVDTGPLSRVISNLIPSGGRLVQGIGVPMSEGWRMAAGALTPRWEKAQPTAFDPLDVVPGHALTKIILEGNKQLGTQPLVTPQARENAGKLIGAAASDYNKDVLKPGFRLAKNAAQGNWKGLEKEAGDVWNRFENDPVGYGLEVIPPVGPGAAKTVLTGGAKIGMKAAMKIAPKTTTKVVGKAANVASQISNAAQPLIDKIPGVLDKYAANEAGKRSAKLLSNVERIRRRLAAAQAEVKPGDVGKIMPGAEIRNKATRKAIKGNTAITNFREAAQEELGVTRKGLQDAGMMSQVNIDAAQWGPAVLRYYKQLAKQKGPRVKPKFRTIDELINTAEGQKALWDYKNRVTKRQSAAPPHQGSAEWYDNLHRENITPEYAPISYAEKNKNVINRFKNGQTMFSRLEEGQNALNSAKRGTSSMYARKSGKRTGKHDKNAARAYTAAIAQQHQVLEVYDYLKWLSTDKRMARSARSYSPEKLQKLLDPMLNQMGGLTSEQRLKFYAQFGDVKVTPKMERILDDMANNRGGFWYHANKAAGGASGLYKGGVLTVDPLFAVRQLIQNEMITNTAMWRGPQDVPRSIMANLIAASGKGYDVLPPEITYAGTTFAGVESREAIVKATAAMMREPPGPLKAAAQKAGSKVNEFTAWNMENVNKADAQARMRIGVYAAMKEFDKLTPAEKTLATRAMDIDATLRNIDAVMARPELAARVLKEVNDWMGDYSKLARQNRYGPAWMGLGSVHMGSWLPFWDWQMHALRVALNAPIKTPYKTAVLAQFSEVAPGVYQPNWMANRYKNLSAVPITNEDGSPVLGPNGHPLLIMKPTFSPFSQVPQDVLWLAHQIKGGEMENDIPTSAPAMTPMINVPMQWQRLQKEYSDPDNYTMKGRAFSQDGKRLRDQSVPLSGVAALGEGLVPRQYDLIQQLWETGLSGPEGLHFYKPTDGSIPGIAHNPAVDPLKKQVESNDAGRIAQGMFGIRGTEMTVDAREEKKMKRTDKRDYRKARRYQRKGLQQKPQYAIPAVEQLWAP